MKAVQFSALGEAEVLALVELPTPAPQAGEVVIKVAAADLESRRTQGKVVLIF